jgi:hypothetical protein
MKSVLKYILLTAARDRLYMGLFVILVAAFGISAVLGYTSMVEESKASIVFIAGSSRLIFVVGMILFTCFHIRKSFDNKEIEFILSKCVSRYNLILTYFVGFVLVALFILIPISLALLLAKANVVGLIVWTISMLFEIFIVISFAILTSLILKSAVASILATLGFYILARMMAFFVLMIDIPDALIDFNTLNNISKSALKILSLAFPRLDMFTKSEWLIYGVSDYKLVVIIVIQSLIYIPLMTFMSFFDFGKKQF